MPAISTNTLCPTSNNNYAVSRGPRGESWSAARRQQRRMSNRKDATRPLYRKDIFYSGSIVNLPQYRMSKGDIRTYMASVTTIPREEADEEVKKIKTFICEKPFVDLNFMFLNVCQPVYCKMIKKTLFGCLKHYKNITLEVSGNVSKKRALTFIELV